MREQGRDNSQQMTSGQTEKRTRKRRGRRGRKSSHAPEINNLLKFGFPRKNLMRSMASCMMELEGSASVRSVDFIARILVCWKSAPIASQNPHYTTANTVMLLSKPKGASLNT